MVIIIVNAVTIINFLSTGKMTNLFLYVLALVVYANVSGGWAVVVWIILFLMWLKSFESVCRRWSFCNTDCRCCCRHSQIKWLHPSVFETPPPYQNDILSEGCVLRGIIQTDLCLNRF